MKNKAAFLAAAMLSLTLTATARAETAEAAPMAEAAPTTEAAPTAVSMSYSTETGMYIYSFEDGCGFQASEELYGGEVTTSALWLATEDEDVEIRVTLDGMPFAYSPTTVLDTEGDYSIQIYHRHADSESVSYAVKIAAPEDIDLGQAVGTEGRLELTPDSEGFYYDFSGAGRMSSNVLDGETVGFPVRLTVPDDLYCTVTRDGAVYSLPKNGIITENGSYSLELTDYSADGSVETRFFGFTVYIGETGRLGVYHPPLGWSLVSVTRSGEPQQHSADMFRFTRDGEYLITYTDGEGERSVTLVRDTAPPVLYFNGGGSRIFDEAVAVTTDTPCTVTVEKNGMPVSGTMLKGTGIYRVTAVDAAGNSTSARVEIQAVSAFNPMNFAVIFGGAAIAAIVYFIVQKNKKPVVR